jgi:hypothetical protein
MAEANFHESIEYEVFVLVCINRKSKGPHSVCAQGHT